MSASHPLPPTPRRNKADRGFALLITVTLLAFVVLLLIGLAAYTRIETAIAGNTQRQAQARENALFALNVAVGQLQKYAGPDQRVTATAEAFGGGANTRRFTGVWTTDSATDPDGDPLTPLTWLVSGNEPLNADGTPVNPLAIAPGAISGSTVQLVGARTVGNGNTNEFIAVPLQEIRTTGVPGVSTTAAPAVVGRYGWWVGDQGVKAPVAVPDASAAVNYAPFDSADARARIRQQIALGAGAADANGNPVFEPRDNNNLNWVAGQKITATNQIAFLRNASNTAIGLSRVQQNFAAWSPTNLAVLANSAAGGLRQDLSLNPGLLGSAFAAWTNYSAYTEPITTTTTTSNENGSTTDVVPTEGILPPYDLVNPVRRRLIMTPHQVSLGEGGAHQVAPILSFFLLTFNVRTQAANGSTSESPLEVRARWMISLWNPYTAALVPEPLRIRVTGLPESVQVINEQESETDTRVGPVGPPISLSAVFGGGLNIKLPWSTAGAPSGAPLEDRHSWLPGRVYTWRSAENLAKDDPLPADGFESVFYSRVLSDAGGGVQRAVDSIGAIPNDRCHLDVTTESPELTVTIIADRASGPVTLGRFTSPQFERVFSTNAQRIGASGWQFSYVFRLAERVDTPATPGAWLTTDGRDVRRRSPPPEIFVVGAKGNNPAAYENETAISAPERLLDRAGNSYTYNEDVPVFELPRGPLLSLGALQHFRLVGQRPFMIGNPWGAAFELNGMRTADLFDRFYFSGLVDGITPATTAAGDLLPPNPLLKPMRKADGARVSIDDVRALMAPTSTTDGDGNTIAGTPSAGSSKFFLQSGAFNLNSTNVAAWIAVLRSVRFPTPQSFSYLDATEATGTAGDDAVATVESGAAHFFRFSQTAQETYKAEAGQSAPGEDVTPPNTHLFRQGMRALTSSEVTALAAKIVELVKAKHAAADGSGGPFRSLAEFLTPSVLFAGTDSDGNVGAARSVLEAAIADAGVNSRIEEFSSQWLTQADIMTALAPTLFARSDTFVVRAYGEAVNPMTNNTEGRAWCEATIQRLPEYFNATADDAATAPGALADPANLNQTYGRRIKVVSFRWLTRSDI